MAYPDLVDLVAVYTVAISMRVRATCFTHSLDHLELGKYGYACQN
jgi:hypothetical protein